MDRMEELDLLEQAGLGDLPSALIHTVSVEWLRRCPHCGGRTIWGGYAKGSKRRCRQCTVCRKRGSMRPGPHPTTYSPATVAKISNLYFECKPIHMIARQCGVARDSVRRIVQVLRFVGGALPCPCGEKDSLHTERCAWRSLGASQSNLELLRALYFAAWPAKTAAVALGTSQRTVVHWYTQFQTDYGMPACGCGLPMNHRAMCFWRRRIVAEVKTGRLVTLKGTLRKLHWNRKDGQK